MVKGKEKSVDIKKKGKIKETIDRPREVPQGFSHRMWSKKSSKLVKSVNF